MNPTDKIEVAGVALAIGGHTRIACPFCNPPDSDSECLRISRREQDKIGFKCWRACCGKSGTIVIGGGVYLHNPAANSASRLGGRNFTAKEYSKDTWWMDHKEIARITDLSTPWLARRIGGGNVEDLSVPESFVPLGCDEGILFPVIGFLGKVGDTVRTDSGKPKYLTFRERDEPFVHYRGNSCRAVVIVEDWLSAMAVSIGVQGVASLAMLGGSTTDEVLNELRKRHRDVIIALDPGADAAAFRLMRRCTLIFDNVSVVRMARDPKRYDWEELRRILEPYLYFKLKEG